MQDAGYGNLQGKVGLVYGGFSFLSLLFVIFYLPELKGRSLEELDELFQKKISVWRFGKHVTEGIGRDIREIDDGDFDSKAPVIEGIPVGETKVNVHVGEKETKV